MLLFVQIVAQEVGLANMLTEQQIRNDITNLSPELIPAYVVSRVQEFEKLRKIYERDIQTFKDLAKQAGINADRDRIMTAEAIRKIDLKADNFTSMGDNSVGTRLIARFLQEIAAQLALFNERCAENCTRPETSSSKGLNKLK